MHTIPDLSHMLQEACSGCKDYSEGILAGIRAFPHIILHGAGPFGQEILEFLEMAGVAKAKISWWDYSYDKPVKIKGIPVFPPFTGNFPPDATLVIHSIRSVPPESQAVPEGYSRLDGRMMYDYFMCPLRVGGGDVFCSLCTRNQRCGAVRCPKLENKSFSANDEKQDIWVLNILTFILGQKCTLSCKHCIQYINHFPRKERMLFPARQIIEDIDQASAAYNFIRVAMIVGGEAFLHPDLPSIVSHALDKNNFGIVKVLTNGICGITDEMIDILKHKRCMLQFTDYTERLTEKQRRLFQTNVDKVAKAGIGHYVIKETWTLPSLLVSRARSNERLREMKANCDSHKNCRQFANGVYYSCLPSMSIHQHHLADYACDRVITNECANVEDLRDKIANCDNQPFYESCRHCDLAGKSILAGEQGIDVRYLHIGSR
ncbi:MAG: radical SAM protein [Zoogloeaceae bacterium]|jgi:hypothetical protein|nr:radical SAM protein [Zoogloeaceae bacterium]